MKTLKQFMISENKEPPMILVLKRTGIRNFAGGQRVAVYKNEQLGVEFAFPYDVSGKVKGPGISSIKEESLSDFSAADKIKINDPDHPKHGQKGTVMYRGKENLYVHFGLNDHSHPFKPHQLVKEESEGDSNVNEEHKHKFSYLGGQAKCECGKYLQPDGRITSVPYPGDVNESAIHHINRIVNSGKEDLVVFRNGGSTRVHPVTAKAILDLHGKVNSHNQSKLSAMINSSPRGLEKVAKFALDVLKKK